MAVSIAIAVDQTDATALSDVRTPQDTGAMGPQVEPGSPGEGSGGRRVGVEARGGPMTLGPVARRAREG